ncbi:uncharacterized protein YbcI [Sinobaca qinghaiensis]|uniref:Uncharacterized protein YbcI n=1 Tax=Sinobaca qinghaiensis TaxID=342944 RepID=A0A419UWY7_9BACL|nr:Na-translocating system protein MpsC family protein [Sinobaca qinghaiensis]RKD69636.1 uncharacterized protein YbcI [Sinobaca qinghaiensis]
MTDSISKQTDIAAYIGRVLRDHFGKGPTSVHVTLEPPFLLMHVQGFLAPMEEILVQQKETQRVEETRHILMERLRPEISRQIEQITGESVQEMYFDWNLHQRTGVLVGLLRAERSDARPLWPAHLDQQAFEQRIIEMSEWGQKIPAVTETFWLSDHLILIKRTGIFVQIEKELIEGGYTEVLQRVKRPMERRMVSQARLEAFLDRPILDTFLDWDFQGDKSLMVLALQPPHQNRKQM